MATIAPFHPDDIPVALALWARVAHIGLSGSDEPVKLAAFLAANPGLSYVAREGSELVAACLCGSDGRRGYLHHLAVAPEHRRRGLGTALLERALTALRAAGIDKCHAFVFRDNPYGAAFWTPAGWTRRDELVIYSRFTGEEETK